LTCPSSGLYKENLAGYPVYITPTLAHARCVAEAGADIIAVDATARPHPEGGDGAGFVALLKRELGMPVLADISTFDEGRSLRRAPALTPSAPRCRATRHTAGRPKAGTLS
jgi:N-acylglucosamine-6-phosphate 2-epimerase